MSSQNETPTDLSRLRALHAWGTKPDWYLAVKALIEQKSTSAEDVAAFLHMQGPAVLGTRTSGIGVRSTLYAEPKEPDHRIRLFSTVRVAEQGDIDPSRFERALRDPDASGVDGLWIEDAKSWKALMKSLPAITPTSIRMLRIGKPPSADDLRAVFASPSFSSLERLSIGGDGTALKGERIAAIAEAPFASSLRQLVLWGADKLTASDWMKLGRAPFSSLESFAVYEGTWLPRASTRDALIGASWMSGLRSLSIDHLTSAECELLRKTVPIEQLVAFSTQVRGGKDPSRPKMLRPLLARLRSCQSLVVGVGPGSDRFDEGMAESLIAAGSVPEMEEVRSHFTDEAAAMLMRAGASGPPNELGRERQTQRWNEAKLWWKWHA